MQLPLRSRTRFERNLFIGIVLMLAIFGAVSLWSLIRARRTFESLHQDLWERQQVEAMQRDLAYFASEQLESIAAGMASSVDDAARDCEGETEGDRLRCMAERLVRAERTPSELHLHELRLYREAGAGWEVEARAPVPVESATSFPEDDTRGPLDIPGRDLDRFADRGRQPPQRRIGTLVSMSRWPGATPGDTERVVVAVAGADGALTERWSRAETAVEAPSLASFIQAIFGRHMLVLFATLAVIGIVAVAVGRYMCARLTGPLAALVGSMARVSSGDLTHRAEKRSEDEFGFLVDSFNSMVTNIERLNEETRETERMKKELEMGRQIQLRLLPQELPRLDGYDVYGENISSLEISGDYYDILPWGSGGQIALAVGDVSGKGIPAALVMSSVRTSLHSEALRPEGGASEWMARMNELLVESTEISKFITFFLALLAPEERKLRYVNAGHNPPFLIREGGDCLELTEGGPIAGVMPGVEFAVGEVELAAGDLLVVFTDGITEAAKGEDDTFEDFGPERLRDLLLESRDHSAEGLAQLIFSAVQEYTGLDSQADDMTLIVMKVLPA
jgi:serine phosphatase RsbU (regulator of sigma subunit)